VSKWLGRSSYFDDLKSLDEELYRGLIQLKQYEGDLEDLALTFTVDVQEFGVTSTVDLVPGGAQIAVTKENRLRYIDLISSFKLNTQIRLQTESFFVGLSVFFISPGLPCTADPTSFDDISGRTSSTLAGSACSTRESFRLSSVDWTPRSTSLTFAPTRSSTDSARPPKEPSGRSSSRLTQSRGDSSFVPPSRLLHGPG
jgi:hypothetical protein